MGFGPPHALATVAHAPSTLLPRSIHAPPRLYPGSTQSYSQRPLHRTPTAPFCMISLCITGQSATAISAAHTALAAAGMAPARGLERDAHINFSTWHERVYQALEQSQFEPGDDGDGGPQGLGSVTMGRLWEQLANDLFLANIDTKVWGWADAKSLALLDFWLELDHSVHFVLIATSPEQYLADHFAQLARQSDPKPQELSVASLLNEWQQAHHTMVRFALHHPKRCILLLADLPLADAALVQAVKAAWARKLSALRSGPADAATSPSHSTDPASALLRHFASQQCLAHPQAVSLHHELASIARPLQASACARGAGDMALHSLLTTVGQSYRIPTLERQAQEAVLLQPRLEAAEVESELLLAQLHQVQEQLEWYFLRNAELQAQVQAQIQAQLQADEDASQRNSAIAQERDALAAARDADAQAAARAHERVLERANEQALAAAQKNDALLAQLHQVQEELERYQLREREYAAQLQAKEQAVQHHKAVAHERDALLVARDADAHAAAQAHERALEQANERAHERALAADQENEVLLSQLHQVQEELERYYLRNQALDAATTLASQRLRRLWSQQPDGIDWESVQVQVAAGSEGAQLRCRATQVAVSDKEWDALEFVAHIHQGALAFSFTRGQGQPEVLTRWPRSAAVADRVTLTAGPDAVDEEGNSPLKEISTSDWDLLRGLPKLLAQGLPQIKGALPQGASDHQTWLDAARATLPALQRQPMALRVDTLRLMANRVVAGREYLVLRAEQLSLAHKRFAALDFRLGCNIGPKGEFGQNARLEFFQGSAPGTFDHWAPNVKDPAGDRLDLVFVFPTSMNLKDWSVLSVNDRGLVLLLVDQLPTLLGHVQTDKLRLTRSLDDWLALANTLRGFARQHLDVTGVQSSLPEGLDKEPALLAPAVPRRARAAKRAVGSAAPANVARARAQ